MIRRLLLQVIMVLAMTDCSTPILGLRPPAPFAAVGVGPLIIAHRGGSLEAPENTLAAFRHGVAAGSDWQELDVTLSSDGQLVVIHDDDLDRTTNGSGPVGKKTWADLQKLTAGQPNWSKEAAIRPHQNGRHAARLWQHLCQRAHSPASSRYWPCPAPV